MKKYKIKEFDKKTAELTANIISGRPSLWDDIGLSFNNLDDAINHAKKMRNQDIAIFDGEKIVQRFIYGTTVY